ncbi:MAG: helix-turn-helix domain-containing protein [Treponemataceae bacterium]
MDIRFFEPLPILKPFIATIWTVESPIAYSPGDLKTILPNGRIKLIFPYRGLLRNSPDGMIYQNNHENSLWFLGISDQPWFIDHDEGAYGTLAVEFRPGAAYRFFNISHKAALNQVVPYQDILGKGYGAWQNLLAEELKIEGKVDLLQKFLITLLSKNSPQDSLVDHAVALIQARKGLITINELSERMGCSTRWLAMKFECRVGISPKTLAEILRFQNQFAFLTRFGTGNKQVDFDDGYFDQAHFTKEFKRFAGLPPAQYTRAKNEFFNLFHRTSESYKTR